MFLLDTDAYTHLRFGHPRLRARAEAEAARGAVIGTTIVTRVEVLRGRYDALLKAAAPGQFLQAQRQLDLAEEAFQRILAVPLDETGLDHFESWKGVKGLKKIGRADLLIACIALARDATLVTRNLKHFRLVPRLKVENWVD